MISLCNYFATQQLFEKFLVKRKSVIFQILDAQTLIKMSAVLKKKFLKMFKVLIYISFTLTLQ